MTVDRDDGDGIFDYDSDSGSSIYSSGNESCSGESFSRGETELRSFRLRVVSPTVCSPTVRVDSPTSHMSVRLRVKTCVTTVDSSTLCAIAIQFLECDS